MRNEPEFRETLQEWISFKTLKRCYRASEDGWHAQVFHLQCGEVGKTVTLIKVGKYIFGGYSDQAWGTGKCYNVTEARDVLLVYNYNYYAIYPWALGQIQFDNNIILSK